MRVFLLTAALVMHISVISAQSPWRFHFKAGDTELVDSSKQRLEQMLNEYRGKSEYVFYIEGHTDSTAGSAYNIKLAQKRATVVVNELIRLGISEGAINTSSWGEDFPLTSNSTEKGRTINRRVDVFVTMEPYNTKIDYYYRVLSLYHQKKNDSITAQVALENEKGEVIGAYEIGNSKYITLKLDKNSPAYLKVMPAEAYPVKEYKSYLEFKEYYKKVGRKFGDTLEGGIIPLLFQEGSKDYIYNGISLGADGKVVIPDATKGRIQTMLDEKWPYYYVFEWVEINPKQLWNKPKAMQLKEAFVKGQTMKKSFDIAAETEKRVFYSGRVIYKPGLPANSFLLIRRMY